MKKLLLTLPLLMSLFACNGNPSNDKFILMKCQYKRSDPVVRFGCKGNLSSVDWGDGTTNKETSHTYTAETDTSYDIKIYGDLTSFTLDAKNITSVDIKIPLEKVSKSAFYSCTNIQSITLPDSITAFDDYAFCGCSSLTSLIVPKNVTYFGAASLATMSLVTLDMTALSTPPAVYDSSAFGGTTDELKFYIAPGTKDQYLQADIWKTFSSDRFIEGTPTL